MISKSNVPSSVCFYVHDEVNIFKAVNGHCPLQDHESYKSWHIVQYFRFLRYRYRTVPTDLLLQKFKTHMCISADFAREFELGSRAWLGNVKMFEKFKVLTTSELAISFFYVFLC